VNPLVKRDAKQQLTNVAEINFLVHDVIQ